MSTSDNIYVILSSVIPLSTPGVVLSGEDVRYAATYGNPYLRGSAPVGKSLNHFIKVKRFDETINTS